MERSTELKSKRCNNQPTPKSIIKRVKLGIEKGLSYKKISKQIGGRSVAHINSKYLKLETKRFWQKDDLKKVKEMLKNGCKYSEIAKKFNRNIASLRTCNCQFWKIPYQWRALGFKKILPDFSEEQKQLLYGGILGDGSLSKPMPNSSYTESHSLKQEEYAFFKIKKFQLFIPESQPEYLNNGGWGGRLIRFRMRSHPFVTNLRKNIYKKNGKKQFGIAFLKKLKPLALAIAYLDDGTISKKSGFVSIHLNDFNERSVKLFTIFLKNKYKIFSNVRLGKKKYPIVYFNRKNSFKFITLIKKYVPECMLYKILVNPLYKKVSCYICKKIFRVSYGLFRVVKGAGKVFLCSKKCKKQRRIELRLFH